MRAISTGMLALLLVPVAARVPSVAVSMTDVVGGSTSSAPGADTARSASPAWGTHADSLRAEALLPASEIRLPLERFLGRYNTDRVLVRRISRAVLRESRRQQVPPSLIAAVLVTENTTLRPEARSSVGAQGLMQVMPMHAGAELCQSSDLVDVDSNICHGTLILARDLKRTSSSTAALLRYNGCVRGTNTPDCRQYPSRVLARASIVRSELLAGTATLAMAVR
jgi:soluble lytic murein transglycosylase-like protein